MNQKIRQLKGEVAEGEEADAAIKVDIGKSRFKSKASRIKSTEKKKTEGQ